MSFGSRARANAVASLAPMLVTLVLTSWMLHGLGPDEYGLWAVLGTVTAMVLYADFGLSATAQRFIGRAHGAGDADAVRRLTVTAVGAALIFAGVLTGIGFAVGGSLVHLFHIPPQIRPAAGSFFRLLGLLVGETVVVSALMACLRARDRYREVAVGTVIAQALWLVAAVWLVSRPDVSLTTLAVAWAAAQAVWVLSLAWASRGAVTGGPLRPVHRAEIRELASFARAMQAVNAWDFVALEAGVLITGVCLPVRDVGYYGIGLAVASALRNFPLYFLTPLYTELASLAGGGGNGEVAVRARRMQHRWMAGLSGYAGLALPAAFAAALLWVGTGYTLSATIAVLLTLGNAVNLGTGVASSYVRSIGRPRLEARYGAVSTLVNLGLAFPLAFALGAPGVAVAAAVGQVVGSVYFGRLVARLPQPLPPFWRQFQARPAAAGASVCAAGTACSFLLPLPTPSRFALVGGAILLGALSAFPAEGARLAEGVRRSLAARRQPRTATVTAAPEPVPVGVGLLADGHD